MSAINNNLTHLLRDPILLETFVDPYTLNCGHSYSKISLIAWGVFTELGAVINGHKGCPLCKGTITSAIQSFALKQIADEFREAQGSIPPTMEMIKERVDQFVKNQPLIPQTNFTYTLRHSRDEINSLCTLFFKQDSKKKHLADLAHERKIKSGSDVELIKEYLGAFNTHLLKFNGEKARNWGQPTSIACDEFKDKALAYFEISLSLLLSNGLDENDLIKILSIFDNILDFVLNKDDSMSINFIKPSSELCGRVIDTLNHLMTQHKNALNLVEKCLDCIDKMAKHPLILREKILFIFNLIRDSENISTYSKIGFVKKLMEKESVVKYLRPVFLNYLLLLATDKISNGRGGALTELSKCEDMDKKELNTLFLHVGLNSEEEDFPRSVAIKLAIEPFWKEFFTSEQVSEKIANYLAVNTIDKLISLINDPNQKIQKDTIHNLFEPLAYAYSLNPFVREIMKHYQRLLFCDTLSTETRLQLATYLPDNKESRFEDFRERYCKSIYCTHSPSAELIGLMVEKLSDPTCPEELKIVFIKKLFSCITSKEVLEVVRTKIVSFGTDKEFKENQEKLKKGIYSYNSTFYYGSKLAELEPIKNNPTLLAILWKEIASSVAR